jgi:hypothetical protein
MRRRPAYAEGKTVHLAVWLVYLYAAAVAFTLFYWHK